MSLVAEHDLARGRRLEPGDHAQRRGLAAPGGAEQREERPRRHVEVQRLHGRERRELLGQAPQPQTRRTSGPMAPALGVLRGLQPPVTSDNLLRTACVCASSSAMKSNVSFRSSSSGKISGLSTRRVVDLLHRLPGALDRTDVVDVGGELRRHLGLVVVVDPLLGVGLVLRLVGHQHVVAPQRQALLGHHELDVGVVELGLDHVAGPCLAGHDVARGQVLDVVVAGEGAHLPGLDHALRASRWPCPTRRR